MLWIGDAAVAASAADFNGRKLLQSPAPASSAAAAAAGGGAAAAGAAGGAAAAAAAAGKNLKMQQRMPFGHGIGVSIGVYTLQMTIRGSSLLSAPA